MFKGTQSFYISDKGVCTENESWRQVLVTVSRQRAFCKMFFEIKEITVVIVQSMKGTVAMLYRLTLSTNKFDSSQQITASTHAFFQYIQLAYRLIC